MFRIKTDIRQYKCESEKKVEKLIRNWVIRPNDLICLSDQDDWTRIGDHPSFVRLFDLLDEQDRALPSTVVTSEVSGSPALDTKDPRATDVFRTGELDEVVAGDRPVSETEDLEEPDAEEEVLEEEVDEEVEDDQSESEDVEADDASSHEEPADEAPKPPEAPEGVEPPARDDEVTTMTDKTLDMMMVPDGAAADATKEVPKFAILKKKRAGRHDVPAELYATTEFESKADEASPDDLVDTQETDAAERDSADAGEEDVGAWDDTVDGIRATTELSHHDVQASLAARGDDEFSDPVDDEEAGWEMGQADTAEGDALGAREPSEPSPDDQELEEEIDEALEDISYDPHSDHVEDPYAVPMPFAIGPSPEDLARGVKKTAASKRQQEKAFPKPAAKVPFQPQRRVFHLSGRPPGLPLAWMLAAGVLIIVGVVLAVLAAGG